MRVLRQSSAGACGEGSAAQVLLGRLPSAGPPGVQEDAGAPGHGHGRPVAALAAGPPGRRNQQASGSLRRGPGLKHRPGHLDQPAHGRAVQGG